MAMSLLMKGRFPDIRRTRDGQGPKASGKLLCVSEPRGCSSFAMSECALQDPPSPSDNSPGLQPITWWRGQTQIKRSLRHPSTPHVETREGGALFPAHSDFLPTRTVCRQGTPSHFTETCKIGEHLNKVCTLILHNIG